MEVKRLLGMMSAATRRVEEGEAQIAAQKRIIADLLAADGNTTEAENVLRTFEGTQARLTTEVNRVQFTLDTLPLFENKTQS